MSSTPTSSNPSLAFPPQLQAHKPATPVPGKDSQGHVLWPPPSSPEFQKSSANPSMHGFILSSGACLQGQPSPPLGNSFQMFLPCCVDSGRPLFNLKSLPQGLGAEE